MFPTASLEEYKMTDSMGIRTDTKCCMCPAAGLREIKSRDKERVRE